LGGGEHWWGSDARASGQTAGWASLAEARQPARPAATPPLPCKRAHAWRAAPAMQATTPCQVGRPRRDHGAGPT
jgi:hypothetical protein